MAITLIAHLNSTPPWLCRLMAVERNQRKSTDERGRMLPVRLVPMSKLVKRSRLTRRTFQRITWQPDWKGISADVASQFREGCRIDEADTEGQLRRFVQEHGLILFKLAPNRLSRERLKWLDKLYGQRTKGRK